MIRCGIDIVATARIRDALERFGDRFAARILTPYEQELGKPRKDFHLFLAGRFAAKEAVYKAMDMPDLTWQQVEIRHEDRRPVVWIDGIRQTDMDLSISHEQDMAVAMVVRLNLSGSENQNTT